MTNFASIEGVVWVETAGCLRRTVLFARLIKLHAMFLRIGGIGASA
jgi:hypothetical protein